MIIHSFLLNILLARVGDCHVRRSPESASVYSCLVPDTLNPNYDVHIISMYQAISTCAFCDHPTAAAAVKLSLSGEALKPIVLVLVSYDPIEWRLTVPSGVEIERVLLVRIVVLAFNCLYSAKILIPCMMI